MIYRIIVDFRNHATFVRVTGCVLTKQSWDSLRTLGLGDVLLERLDTLIDKQFSSEERFLRAVERLLGHDVSEKHRLTILNAAKKEYAIERELAIPFESQPFGEMTGASFGWFAEIMNKQGLVAPQLENRRARFYFTEKGWDKVGRDVVAKATQKGHTVKVIRRKEPDESQVVYRDALQVALLPRRRNRSAPST